jgi:hypothetical protein
MGDEVTLMLYTFISETLSLVFVGFVRFWVI